MASSLAQRGADSAQSAPPRGPALQRPTFDRALTGCKSLLLICGLAVSSCVDFLGDNDAEKRIAGTYILESVDGVLLPALLAPQEGCNRTVRKVAELVLVGGGQDTQPWYSWEIRVDADCQPVPAGVFQGASDMGLYRINSTQLSLRSQMGEGAYTADLEETSGSPSVIKLSHLGNSYRFRRMDDPIGVAYVSAVDQFGQIVEGVILHYTFQHGLEGGGTIGPAGEYGTSGPIGECSIMMTLPAGYELPASQPNPFTVTVVENPAIHVQVILTKL